MAARTAPPSLAASIMGLPEGRLLGGAAGRATTRPMRDRWFRTVVVRLPGRTYLLEYVRARPRQRAPEARIQHFARAEELVIALGQLIQSTRGTPVAELVERRVLCGAARRDGAVRAALPLSRPPKVGTRWVLATVRAFIELCRREMYIAVDEGKVATSLARRGLTLDTIVAHSPAPRGRRTRLAGQTIDEMIALDRTGTSVAVLGISLREPKAP